MQKNKLSLPLVILVTLFLYLLYVFICIFLSLSPNLTLKIFVIVRFSLPQFINGTISSLYFCLFFLSLCIYLYPSFSTFSLHTISLSLYFSPSFFTFYSLYIYLSSSLSLFSSFKLLSLSQSNTHFFQLSLSLSC